MKGIHKIQSWIDGFDEISIGGIPKNRMTLISGTPGSGKTIFCSQFLIGAIINSKEPGVFVTFEEAPEDIIKNMKEFGWNIDEYINDKLWSFVDVSPKLDDNITIMGDFDLSGLIVQIKNAVRKIGAKRVVLDPLAALFNKYPNVPTIRKEIIRIKSCLKSLSVTSLVTSERYKEIGINSHYDILDFVSDNVIIMKNQMFEEYRRRTIEILKYRGADHKMGQRSFTIKGGRGITVISFDRDPDFPKTKRIRKSTGIKKLDEMTDGGFFQGSSILISGQTGTGKTLINLSMLAGALKRGEKCMLYNFEESNQQIIQKISIWEEDFSKAEENGIFQMYSVYPESQSIESLIVEMRSAMQNFSPDRIYIDSISALERITTHLTFRESLINLFLFAREKNIMTTFTTTTPTFSEYHIESEKHISTLCDAILLLRYFEREGEIIRCIAIMKLRDSNHTRHFLEYKIDERGIHILDAIKKNTGIFNSFNVNKI